MSNPQRTLFDDTTYFSGPIVALLASHDVSTDTFYILHDPRSIDADSAATASDNTGKTYSTSIFNFNFYYNARSDIIISARKLLKNPKRNLQHVFDYELLCQVTQKLG